MKFMKCRFIALAFVAALAISARAEIVYTPVNVGIGIDGHYHIDLNGDGITDFTIANTDGDERCYVGSIHWDKLVAGHPKGNKLVGTSVGGASALPEGIEVGPTQSFSGNGFMAEFLSGRDVFGVCEPSPHWWGNWIGVTSAYLGVEFLINGELHYGWIASGGGLTPTVTGFAYETAAGQSIVTGQTSGP